MNPDSPAIIDSMGWVLYKLGDYSAARDYLERAYRLEQDPEIAAHLVDVRWQLGERDSALELLRAVARAQPRQPSPARGQRAARIHEALARGAGAAGRSAARRLRDAARRHRRPQLRRSGASGSRRVGAWEMRGRLAVDSRRARVSGRASTGARTPTRSISRCAARSARRVLQVAARRTR